MSRKTRILFTGDSITDAWRTDVLGSMAEWLKDPNMTQEYRESLINGTLGTGYPLLVASQLTAEEPGRWEILNRGVSGNRVVDLDARIKVDCINLKPDVVSILIGINDVWHELEGRNGVAADKFRRIYNGLLQEITEALPGVRLVLLEPYVLEGPCTGECWDYFRRETDLRRQVVRELSESYHAVRMDTQKLFDEASARSCPADWSADGVHPTAAGHWLLAQEWLRLFRESVAEV